MTIVILSVMKRDCWLRPARFHGSLNRSTKEHSRVMAASLGLFLSHGC